MLLVYGGASWISRRMAQDRTRDPRRRFACAGPRADVSWPSVKLLWILPAAVILTSDTPDFAQRRNVWHQSCDAIRHEKPAP
jgi:hypothetical protein